MAEKNSDEIHSSPCGAVDVMKWPTGRRFLSLVCIETLIQSTPPNNKGATNKVRQWKLNSLLTSRLYQNLSSRQGNEIVKSFVPRSFHKGKCIIFMYIAIYNVSTKGSKVTFLFTSEPQVRTSHYSDWTKDLCMKRSTFYVSHKLNATITDFTHFDVVSIFDTFIRKNNKTWHNSIKSQQHAELRRQLTYRDDES